MAAEATSQSELPTLDCLDTPSFIVWEDRVRQNCRDMVAKAKALGVALRPHVKTHKVPEVQAILQAEAALQGVSITGIVASTLAAVRDKHPSLTLRLLLDSSEGVAKCGEHVEDGAAPWPVFLKVDCGYSRAGVSPITTPTKALQVARDIHKSPQFTLFGLYAHSGNAYNCKGGKPEAAQVAHSEAEVISDFAQALASEGISVDAVGVGSTPSAAACTALPSSITEMHPGNFLFYDLQQVDSGSCSLGDIACGVLTSIIGVYPERNEVLIDAGGTAMHKDPGGVEGWGRVHGHADLSLLRMSQECTVVGVQPALKASPGKPLAERFRLGDKLFVLPNHSCMTACQHEVYHVTKQPTDAQVLTQWKPCKFW